MVARTNGINQMAMADSCPEKAGVGGSIPSLATTHSPHFQILTRTDRAEQSTRLLSALDLIWTSESSLEIGFGPGTFTSVDVVIHVLRAHAHAVAA